MSILIKLLGRPGVFADGTPVPAPPGRKSWALLAYLVASPAPVPRNRLAALLFPDAQDGLAALRWNLAQLRRSLGAPRALAGDPVSLALGPGVRTDVQVLGAAPWFEAVALADLTAPLLEGLEFPGCPGFALWLDGERQRVAGLAAAALREAVRTGLASDRPGEAVSQARALVSIEPWDEDTHQLLVRALAQAGDIEGARAHVRVATDLLLDQMGVAPSRSLAAAAEPVMALPTGASRGRTLVQLQAGAAAMSAGAADAGVESLRRAVAGARAVGDSQLLAQALTALGSAEVHAVRGSDESGVAALREAVAVAERIGRLELSTTASRELGWVEFLRGRVESAERWLDRAITTVGADDGERAWILLTRGSLRSDVGRHDEALPLLREGVRLAKHAGARRAAAMALTHLGRLHLLRGELGPARADLEEAMELATDAGWLSFVPYPQAWLGELALREGRVNEAAELLGQAHALAVEVADPCYESLAGRGLGLVAAARGETEAADRLLHQAPLTCRRFTDTYVWVEVYALAAQAQHAVTMGNPRALDLVDQLSRLASGHGMRELQAEAALLGAELGLPGALDVARAHLSAVDNPALVDRLGRLESLATS